MRQEGSKKPTRLPNGTSQRTARSWAGSKLQRSLLLAAVLLILLLAFALVPIPGGDDWETFYGAARRILAGSPLYGSKITHAYYSNPPWLASFFVPLGLLPFRWSSSVVSIASLAIVALLALRYKAGTFKLVLVLLPPYLWPLGAPSAGLDRNHDGNVNLLLHASHEAHSCIYYQPCIPRREQA